MLYLPLVMFQNVHFKKSDKSKLRVKLEFGKEWRLIWSLHVGVIVFLVYEVYLNMDVFSMLYGYHIYNAYVLYCKNKRMTYKLSIIIAFHVWVYNTFCYGYQNSFCWESSSLKWKKQSLDKSKQQWNFPFFLVLYKFTLRVGVLM